MKHYKVTAETLQGEQVAEFHAEGDYELGNQVSSAYKYDGLQSYRTVVLNEDVEDISLSQEWLTWFKIEDEGDFSGNLYGAELAKEMRQNLKAVFGKGYKFSVTTGRGGYTTSVTVALMSAPVEVLLNGQETADVNHFWLDEQSQLTSAGLAIFKLIYDVVMKRHWDKSDVQSDYFNTAFYMHMQVGKWNKPFQVKI